MNGFHDLIESGSHRVSAYLRSRGPAAGTGEVLESVGRFSLPGLLGLLALGRKSQPAPPAGAVQDLSREGISKALSTIAEKRGVPFTPEQVHDVIELLATGQLCEDVGSGAAVALHTVPGVPWRIIGDLKQIPQLIPALVIGISRDLKDCPHLILDVVGDLKDGRLDSQHQIMVHTLRAFFQVGTAAAIINLLRTLLGPEYETFRLAIIVYAASKGVHLDADDLDRLREALDPNNPDLGPLLESAFDQLLSTYPETRVAQRILQSLAGQPEQ